MLSFRKYAQQPNLVPRQLIEVNDPVSTSFAAACRPPPQLADTARAGYYRTRHGMKCDECGNRLAVVVAQKLYCFPLIDRRFDNRIHIARLWQCRSPDQCLKVANMSRFIPTSMLPTARRQKWPHNGVRSVFRVKQTNWHLFSTGHHKIQLFLNLESASGRRSCLSIKSIKSYPAPDRYFPLPNRAFAAKAAPTRFAQDCGNCTRL